MRRLFFAVVLSLVVYLPASSQSEPLVWTYAESWWENATPDQTNNCISQEQPNGQEPFVTCSNARFRLTVRQTAELNPAANAHGVEQTVRIKDGSNGQVVSEEITSDFYAGTQTIFTAQTSHDVDVNADGSGMGPFEGLREHVPQCPGTGHPGGGGTLGWHGFANLTYVFHSIHVPGNPGRAWYTHRPHPDNACPSICEAPWMTLVITAGRPDRYARIVVPIAWLLCSPAAGGVETQFNLECFDILYYV